MLYLTLPLLRNVLLFQLRERIISNYSGNACTRIMIRIVVASGHSQLGGRWLLTGASQVDYQQWECRDKCDNRRQHWVWVWHLSSRGIHPLRLNDSKRTITVATNIFYCKLNVSAMVEIGTQVLGLNSCVYDVVVQVTRKYTAQVAFRNVNDDQIWSDM